MTTEHYAGLLRERGLKATRTRILVLEILGRAQNPQNAAAIRKEANSRGPVDKVTVYRTLEALFQAGLLDRVGGERAWHYHLIVGPDHNRHPHFHCTDCGAFKCLPPEALSLDMARLKAAFPARVDHLQVNLEGVCPDCLAHKS